MIINTSYADIMNTESMIANLLGIIENAGFYDIISGEEMSNVEPSWKLYHMP